MPVLINIIKTCFFRNSEETCSNELILASNVRSKKKTLRLGRATKKDLRKVQGWVIADQRKAIYIVAFTSTVYTCENLTVKKIDREKLESFKMCHWVRALQIIKGH